MTTGQRDIAIVGVAESDVMGTVPNKSSLQHHAEAGHNALEDAGLSKSDVDGLLTAGGSTLVTAEYMGISPTANSPQACRQPASSGSSSRNRSTHRSKSRSIQAQGRRSSSSRVRGQSCFMSLDSARSASSFPPVWQAAQ